MRLSEQTKFLPLFPHDGEGKTGIKNEVLVAEMAEVVVQLAKSIEILASALLRVGGDILPL